LETAVEFGALQNVTVTTKHINRERYTVHATDGMRKAESNTLKLLMLSVVNM
jgi:hypothetical protein